MFAVGSGGVIEEYPSLSYPACMLPSDESCRSLSAAYRVWSNLP